MFALDVLDQNHPKSKRQLLFGISRGSSLYFGVAFEVDGVPLVPLLAASDSLKHREELDDFLYGFGCFQGC